MIEIGGTSYAFSDPAVMLAIAGGLVVLLVLWLLIATVRRTGQAARTAAQLASQMGGVTARVQSLSDGQQQLFGGLNSVSEAQAAQQQKTLQLMEQRLASVTEAMNQNLSSTARNTAQSLGELQQRLQTIDKAQENITKLSGDVLSLQDILSNKQTRGAFGEIQLTDIVGKALPGDSFALQATLSNGKRVDCLVHLPNPPGPIAIDSKFPLEAYEALRRASTDREANEAARALRVAVKKHIKDIAERYIIDGETADGALMFLPSEAVYAELHANFPEVVREGFAARVWIVSPTTCMATLNTMRAILKDARMREQAGAIRKTLGQLHRDVELVVERVDKLNTHFGQARKDLDEINTAAERAGKRAGRLNNFDFEEIAPEDRAATGVVPPTRPDHTPGSGGPGTG
ncbi:MAG: DNA recombination protein RmuC [Salibaculum sp.]|jgi:DNA recombination protein RmuC|uniref:DNA recombination protein RmuC n=1 Tax=Salibaculum sp. TaxID=2855480 RepID=UPI0028708134|nr:DNA recombination protein RmuC [Salibaculum sp.]MDR9427814.1 DNA recombination protein RmuC [Salibaculum sp.]MDR9481989.1 DNA recombination protein RmuC [Salibaculum sp.]